MTEDMSAFNIPEEFGAWVDERFANAINAATTPENLANFATAVSGAMQSFLSGETDRAIAAAEAQAGKVISSLLGVIGQPVATLLGDLTGTVNQTGQGLSSEIGSVTSSLTGLAGQIISGILADLPHLLVKYAAENRQEPDVPPST